MSDWQPIETAPKDGTIVRLPVIGEIRAYWCKDLERWVSVVEQTMNYASPDRWKPDGTDPTT